MRLTIQEMLEKEAYKTLDSALFSSPYQIQPEEQAEQVNPNRASPPSPSHPLTLPQRVCHCRSYPGLPIGPG